MNYEKISGLAQKDARASIAKEDIKKFKESLEKKQLSEYLRENKLDGFADMAERAEGVGFDPVHKHSVLHSLTVIALLYCNEEAKQNVVAFNAEAVKRNDVVKCEPGLDYHLLILVGLIINGDPCFLDRIAHYKAEVIRELAAELHSNTHVVAGLVNSVAKMYKVVQVVDEYGQGDQGGDLIPIVRRLQPRFASQIIGRFKSTNFLDDVLSACAEGIAISLWQNPTIPSHICAVLNKTFPGKAFDETNYCFIWQLVEEPGKDVGLKPNAVEILKDLILIELNKHGFLVNDKNMQDKLKFAQERLDWEASMVEDEEALLMRPRIVGIDESDPDKHTRAISYALKSNIKLDEAAFGCESALRYVSRLKKAGDPKAAELCASDMFNEALKREWWNVKNAKEKAGELDEEVFASKSLLESLFAVKEKNLAVFNDICKELLLSAMQDKSELDSRHFGCKSPYEYMLSIETSNSALFQSVLASMDTRHYTVEFAKAVRDKTQQKCVQDKLVKALGSWSVEEVLKRPDDLAAYLNYKDVSLKKLDIVLEGILSDDQKGIYDPIRVQASKITLEKCIMSFGAASIVIGLVTIVVVLHLGVFFTASTLLTCAVVSATSLSVGTISCFAADRRAKSNVAEIECKFDRVAIQNFADYINVKSAEEKLGKIVL